MLRSVQAAHARSRPGGPETPVGHALKQNPPLWHPAVQRIASVEYTIPSKLSEPLRDLLSRMLTAGAP